MPIERIRKAGTDSARALVENRICDPCSFQGGFDFPPILKGLCVHEISAVSYMLPGFGTTHGWALDGDPPLISENRFCITREPGRLSFRRPDVRPDFAQLLQSLSECWTPWADHVGHIVRQPFGLDKNADMVGAPVNASFGRVDAVTPGRELEILVGLREEKASHQAAVEKVPFS